MPTKKDTNTKKSRFVSIIDFGNIADALFPPGDLTYKCYLLMMSLSVFRYQSQYIMVVQLVVR